MKRTMLKCCVLLVPLTFTAIGCFENRQPTANQNARVATASNPVDPLERNRGLQPMTTPGRFRVTGSDRTNSSWEGYLVVDLAPDNYMRVGYFEWTSKVGGGRYLFEGTFDTDTRIVRWNGYSVQDRIGSAANAHYQATLSPDGLQLLNGSWSGGISIPGTWMAEFQGG